MAAVSLGPSKPIAASASTKTGSVGAFIVSHVDCLNFRGKRVLPCGVAKYGGRKKMCSFTCFCLHFCALPCP
jgi:hypothetical protein